MQTMLLFHGVKSQLDVEQQSKQLLSAVL